MLRRNVTSTKVSGVSINLVQEAAMQTLNSDQISHRNGISAGLLSLALLVGLLITPAVFGQGTVQFNTRLTAGSPPYYTQVFLAGVDEIVKSGNTAANLPAGTQTYTGSPLTGSGWSAQLFALPGSTIPVGPMTSYGVLVNDTMVAGFGTTTFRTGTSAGSVAGITATLPNIAPDAASAVLQMRVFPTVFGTWANAVAAFNSGSPGGIIGASPMFVVNQIGGSINPSPQLTGVSFSIGVPEPSGFALTGLGMAALLISRRRK